MMERESNNILEFIDGTLDAGSEQQLFEQFVDRVDLRRELQQFIQIGEAVRSDREAYTPPADVERDLLGGLGLMPIGSAAGAGAVGGSVASGAAAAGGATLLGLGAMKSSVLPMLLGLLLGAFLAGGSVYMAMKGNDGSSSSEQIASTANRRSANNAPNLANGTNGSKSGIGDRSEAIEERSSAATPKVVYVEKPVYVEKIVEKIIEVPVNAKKENVTDQLPQQVAMDSSNANSTAAIQSLEPTLPLSVDAVEPTESIDLNGELEYQKVSPDLIETPAGSELNSKSVQVELRKGLITNSLVDLEIESDASRFGGDFGQPESFAGGLYYSPDNQTYYGIEFGRERYSQSLFYNHGDSIMIKQRPIMTWGTITVGQNLQVFNLPVSVQGGLGASQYGGPLLRARLGLDMLNLPGLNGLGASGRLSLPISLEGSSLVYRYNGQYLISGNWGMNVGLRYRIDL